MSLGELLKRFPLLRMGKSDQLTDKAEDALSRVRVFGEQLLPGSESVRFASTNANRNSWIAWRDPLRELGVELRNIGRRGHALLKDGKQVLNGGWVPNGGRIKLDGGQWQVQQRSAGGWQVIARDWGRESLRALTWQKITPPPHPLFEKR